MDADSSCNDLSPKSAARRISSPSPSSPSPKRSRRSIQKRVVSIPIQEAAAEGSRAKGVSDFAPPSDSWAWRKYGQKPIKGSPYPRGYYRCSSSKGCPARKQVERSKVDPTMLLVTYTCDHNHTWPLPKTSSSSSTSTSSSTSSSRHAAVKDEPEQRDHPDQDPVTTSPDPDPEESRFSDLMMIGAESMMMTPDDFWYSDVGSTSSTSPPSDTLLYGPIFFESAELAAGECEKVGDSKDDEEEDALFAGLGELPEYSTVFRRSYLDRSLAVHTAVHQ